MNLISGRARIAIFQYKTRTTVASVVSAFIVEQSAGPSRALSPHSRVCSSQSGKSSSEAKLIFCIINKNRGKEKSKRRITTKDFVTILNHGNCGKVKQIPVLMISGSLKNHLLYSTTKMMKWCRPWKPVWKRLSKQSHAYPGAQRSR